MILIRNIIRRYLILIEIKLERIGNFQFCINLIKQNKSYKIINCID